MKIIDVDLVSFKVKSNMSATKWGYSEFGPETEKVQSFTQIRTDDGLEGYSEQGFPFYFYTPTQDEIEGLVKPLLLGEDPLNRERLWQLMSRHNRFPKDWLGISTVPYGI